MTKDSIITDQEDYRILVIDDDKRLRDLLERYLSEQGFEVTTAKDAVRAKSLFNRRVFDLVILDIMMPEENGFDITKSIRKTSNVPILLLSARGDPEARIIGLEAGANDYLSKPFEPIDLLIRIKQIINQ